MRCDAMVHTLEDRRRQHKVRAKLCVEVLRNVACELNVLPLVLAHRHVRRAAMPVNAGHRVYARAAAL
jgi:hypothetical protein